MGTQEARIGRFRLELPEKTQAGAEAFLREVLDPQIEELEKQLLSLQNVRRAIAGCFAVDRREGVGTIAAAHDAARRAQLEGEGGQTSNGRLVPRRADSAP